MSEMIVDATVENIETITAYVDARLEEMHCPVKLQRQVDIAIDEIVGNIARYAYAPGIGQVAVRVEFAEQPLAVVLSFEDSGVPFDPLHQADPNTTLAAEDREIGGLGIYMVKKCMDSVSYVYKDGKNILTIGKRMDCV